MADVRHAMVVSPGISGAGGIARSLIVIALLFALLLVCMLLAWRGQKSASLVLFGIVVVVSAYWLKFHATSQLTIML